MSYLNINSVFNEIGEKMDFTNLWIAFAIVFIGLPIAGSIAMHWRPNDK